MRDHGFSLLELLTTMIILGIVAAIGTVNYVGWRAKYDMENEIKKTHVDLMNVRLMAMTRNMSHFVSLAANQMKVYGDTNGDGALNTGSDTIQCLWDRPTGQGSDAACPNAQSVSVKTFPYPVRWSGSAIFGFDSRGLASEDETICIDFAANPDVDASYDCLDIGSTRVSMGKLVDRGGACNSANCRKKR